MAAGVVAEKMLVALPQEEEEEEEDGAAPFFSGWVVITEVRIVCWVPCHGMTVVRVAQGNAMCNAPF